MEVHEILNGKKEVIKFLEEKGFHRERDYSDEEHTNGDYFRIGKKKLLVIYEVPGAESVKEIKDHFLIDRGLSYCIILLDKKLIFLRNFGETKHFIYSENTQGLSKVSKEDRLKKIGDKGFDFIFQAGKDISGQFYKSFKSKRDLLVQNIKNNAKPVQKYLIAQKIFDRFFFIYFLCHKKIIKSNGGNISGANLFEILLKQKDFLKSLKDLFHKFNIQGEQRTLKFNGYELFIPYLNGGLFRPDVLEQNLNITLKNKQWEEIFEFLNSYHWIIEDVKVIEENEDKILTPEILGHVYERSVVEWESEGFEKEAEKAVKKITERKKKGVYYTPESITEYISNNTIKPYLLNKLKNKYESFGDLIGSKNKRDMKEALKLLDEIKVLDPACGSGAFLIKASEVIFNLKRRLNYELKNKQNFYDLKLEIITENIYGVDILAGAVEISKLRLWLWLISDYDSISKVEPLPNIEYNLMQGNSLIGFTSFKGKLLEVSKKLKEKTEKFEKLKSEYKTSYGKTSDIIRELLEKEMKSVRSELNSLYIKDLTSRGVENFKVKKEIQFNFFGEKTKLKHEKFMYQDEFERELTPFHWVLEFSEVFKGDNPGFDVVIGNPPYISFGLRDVGKLPDYMKRFYNTIYSNSSEYKINIYPIFMQRGIDLTNKCGGHSFIVPDSFLLGRYFSKIRKYILDNCKINKILFLPYVVFPGATIGVSIIYIFNKNKNNKDNKLKAILAYDNEEIKTEGVKNYSYSQDYFKTIDYNRFRLFFDEDTFEIIKNIDSGEKLNNHFGMYSGCIARYGQDSLINHNKTSDFILKDEKSGKIIFKDNDSKNRWKNIIISGGDFNRYSNLSNKQFMYINKDINILRKITKSGFDFEKYEKPKLFMRQTGDHITATFDSTGCYCLNNVHLVFLKDNLIDIKYLLGILNSRLMDFYYKKISLEEGRTMAQIDIETAELLSIKNDKRFTKIVELVEYLLFVHKNEVTFQKIDYFLDCLVYELYLKEKLKSNLIELVSPLIRNISKTDSESDKLKIIESFVKKISTDKKIDEEINKIKNHRLVKIIEQKNGR